MQMGICGATAHGRECTRPVCKFSHTIPTIDTAGTEFQQTLKAALNSQAEYYKAKSTSTEAAVLAMQATQDSLPPSQKAAETAAAATAAAAGAAAADEEHPARKDKPGVTSTQATIGYGLFRRQLWDPGSDND